MTAPPQGGAAQTAAPSGSCGARASCCQCAVGQASGGLRFSHAPATDHRSAPVRVARKYLSLTWQFALTGSFLRAIQGAPLDSHAAAAVAGCRRNGAGENDTGVRRSGPTNSWPGLVVLGDLEAVCGPGACRRPSAARWPRRSALASTPQSPARAAGRRTGAARRRCEAVAGGAAGHRAARPRVRPRPGSACACDGGTRPGTARRTPGPEPVAGACGRATRAARARTACGGWTLDARQQVDGLHHRRLGLEDVGDENAGVQQLSELDEQPGVQQAVFVAGVVVVHSPPRSAPQRRGCP